MTLYDSNHRGSAAAAVASNEAPGSLQADIQERFERLGKLKNQYLNVFDDNEQQVSQESEEETICSWFDDSWSDLKNFDQINWQCSHSKKSALKRSESTPEHWNAKVLEPRPRAGSISKQNRKKSVGSGMHKRERCHNTPATSGNGNAVWNASKPKDKTSKTILSSGDLKKQSHRRKSSRDSLDDLADLRFDVRTLLRHPRRPIRKTRSGDDSGHYTPSLMKPRLRQAQSVGNLVQQQQESSRSLQSGKHHSSKLDLKRSNHTSSGQSMRTSRSSLTMVDRSCKSHSIRRRSAMQAPTTPLSDRSTKMKGFSSMLDMSTMKEMSKSSSRRPLTNGSSHKMDMSKSSSMMDMSKPRRRRGSRRTSSGSSDAQRKAAQQRAGKAMTMSSPSDHGSRRSTLAASGRKGSRHLLVADPSCPSIQEERIVQQKLEKSKKERACRPSAPAMDFSTAFVVRSSA